jgi:hypothetical protein
MAEVVIFQALAVFGKLAKLFVKVRMQLIIESHLENEFKQDIKQVCTVLLVLPELRDVLRTDAAARSDRERIQCLERETWGMIGSINDMISNDGSRGKRLAATFTGGRTATRIRLITPRLKQLMVVIGHIHATDTLLQDSLERQLSSPTENPGRTTAMAVVLASSPPPPPPALPSAVRSHIDHPMAADIRPGEITSLAGGVMDTTRLLNGMQLF